MLQQICNWIEFYKFKRTIEYKRAFLLHPSTICLSRPDAVPRYFNLLNLNKMCIEKNLSYACENKRDHIASLFNYFSNFPEVPIIVWRESDKFNIKLWREMGLLSGSKISPFKNEVIELKSMLIKSNPINCNCDRNLIDILKYNNLHVNGILEGKDEPLKSIEIASNSTNLKNKAMYELMKKALLHKKNLTGPCRAHL